MSPNLDREAHRRIVDELLNQDDLHALNAHVDDCPFCQEEAARRRDGKEPSSVRELLQQVLAVAPPAVIISPPSVNGHARPQLPGYELLDELDRGGMGVVYKARQVALDRLVAVKMMQAGSRATREERARFRVEAEAVARLQHPNITQIHEVGEHDHNPYLALEYVSGGTLAAKLDGRALPERQAAELVLTLALAMDYAHQRGVIHRDLKPANVLLTDDGVPKITDFGLAKQLDKHNSLTDTGAAVGTPCYMAPEQARGKSKDTAVGPATDVYALGVILYELVTGRPPFTGDTAVEVLHQVIYDRPQPPRDRRPNLDRDLEMICLKCLEKDPHKRYQSAGALAVALRRFLDGRSLWRDWRNWSAATTTAAAALVALFLTFGVDWDAERTIANLKKGLGEAESRERALTARLDTTEKVTIPELEKQRKRVEQARQSAEERLKEETARATDLQAKLTKAEQERETVAAQLKEAEEGRIPKLKLDLTAANAREKDLKDRLALAETEAIPKLERLLHEAKEGHSKAEVRLKEEMARVTDLQAKLATTEKERQPIAARLKEAEETTIPKLKNDLARAEGRAEALIARLDKAEKILPDLWKNLEQAEKDIAVAVARQDMMEKEIPALRKKVEKAEADLAKEVAAHNVTKEKLAHEQNTVRPPKQRGDGGDSSQKKASRPWKGHEDKIMSLVLSSDGNQALSVSLDKTVQLWDMKTGTQRHCFKGHKQGALCAALSPDARWAASGGLDKTVRVWNVTSGEEVLCLEGHKERVLKVAFTADGSQILSASLDGTIRVWDLECGAEVQRVSGLFKKLRADRQSFEQEVREAIVAFSPSGSHVLSTDLWNRVQLWDVKSGKLAHEWDMKDSSPSYLTFAPDGKA